MNVAITTANIDEELRKVLDNIYATVFNHMLTLPVKNFSDTATSSHVNDFFKDSVIIF